MDNIDATHTGQPASYPYPIITPEAQQQLVLGSVAIGTMVCLTVLIREIRLLVEVCKS